MPSPDSIEGVDRAGSDLTKNSDGWGFTKITIPSGPTAKRPDSKSILSCKVFHFSGTATFVDSTTATTASIPLPTTPATALTLPIKNLNEMSFIGTANDVVGIIWRQ
jgi:hypothetical protein